MSVKETRFRESANHANVARVKEVLYLFVNVA